MKTQVSRDSFKPQQRYSAVYQQMGRMLTDADWNELSDTQKHQLTDTIDDVIGSGTPRKRGVVMPTGSGGWELRWGHLYVDGIHARLVPSSATAGVDFDFSLQADFPGAPALTAGEHRLYADVWERSVTHLQDANLLDAGLKGADTTSRSQTMAQIKYCSPAISVSDILHNDTINPRIGKLLLDLDIREGQTVKDPCDPCADELALQAEVGNYLFRVEVHDVSWSSDAVPEITELVLKWSSENAAEQYVVGQLPPGFSSSQWVYEFFSGEHVNAELNQVTEKHLGHHLSAGFSPSRGTLVDGYPVAAEPADLPLVRRWDGFVRLSVTAGGWNLVEGVDRGRELSESYSSTDHGFVDLSGPLAVNLHGLNMRLDPSDPIALAGDYWQVPVRHAIHSAGTQLLQSAEPRGIVHHYMVLGLVQVDGSGVITAFTPDNANLCKPFDFPSLTDIRADDVCYENSACNMPEVHTVQDAIDFLCRERDLRWHNKHLHGSGVVCGMRVQCAPATFSENGSSQRRRITVTDGYAIACEGDDMVLDLPQHFDVIAAIEKLQSETGTTILDANGNGKVCLYIELGEGGAPRLKIVSGEEHKQENIFDGTIWMDFYQECIKGLIEELRAELGDLNLDDINEQETKNGELVSAQRKKLTSLLNLVVYLFYQPHGRYVFTSKKEHVILRNFYLRIRELLQSKTFCGMYKGDDFPDYPFAETAITTYFGKNHHTRLLPHPDGRFLLSYQGADTSINIYDTEAETLQAVTEVPSAQGGETTAVCFSSKGDLIYAAVDVNGTDSILSRGRFSDGKVEWEVSAVVCGVKVADLRFIAGNDVRLFMLGYYEGLYLLNTDKVFGEEKIIPAPTVTFNAVGQVAYDLVGGMIYATANNPEDERPTRYDRIAQISIEKAIANADNTPLHPATFLLTDQNGGALFGDDDIAIKQANANRVSELYVVVDQLGSNNSSNGKQLLQYLLREETNSILPQLMFGELANTEVRLSYHEKNNQLIVSLQDEFRLQLYNNGKLEVERVPVQIMPIGLAINPHSSDVYALNFLSNTVTAIPVDELNISDQFTSQLAEYRYAVLLAFLSLFGNLLQNLKDCFCHLLLVKCPRCDDDKVWLASISVEANEVYKICNIGKRKEVWTFPKIGYWFSIVPVLPLLKAGLSKICCAVLPNLFNTRVDDYEKSATVVAPISGATYMQTVHQVKRTDSKVLWRENSRDLDVMSRIVRDRFLFKQHSTQQDSIAKQELRNMQTLDAVAKMEQAGMQVEVKDYREDQAGVALQQYQQTPRTIAKGSHVTLYQDRGKVLFYAAQTPAADSSINSAELAQLESRKQTLADMQLVNESLARAETRKQSVTALDEVQSQLVLLDNQRQQTAEEVAVLQEQLNGLKTQRVQALNELQQMQSGMTALNTNLKQLTLDMTKQRPVVEIAAVDVESQVLLKREGILTINDLAGADANKLSEQGIDKAKAELMVKEAQSKLQLLR